MNLLPITTPLFLQRYIKTENEYKILKLKKQFILILSVYVLSLYLIERSAFKKEYHPIL